MRAGFTLLELLVVIGIISLMLAILLPALSKAREASKASACLSNQRQVGIAARMYMDYYEGGLYHHHEGWVLDDGSQVEELPATPGGCVGGGLGNSQAEKPWVIFFQPFLDSRTVAFCPSDPTKKSRKLATDLMNFNGCIERVDDPLPVDCELSIAEGEKLTIESYLINSIFTHRSARYAVEGVLPGFATDTVVAGMRNKSLIMFSERNSEALNAPENEAFGSIIQDDYDTWVGEAALVQWGDEAGRFSNEGWIRYNRHGSKGNYIYEDGHAATLRWSTARFHQYPDAIVRRPLQNPPP